jgi:RNA polymerase sigma-70 factor (ECF subfamily)
MAITVCGGSNVPAKDGTLVLGVLNGDRSAFAELYDRRARLIRAICYDHTHDPHTAADLAQEVFLRAYRNLRRLRDPERFTAWLAAIARQVCREWHRKQRRERSGLACLAERQEGAARWTDPPDQRLTELRDRLASVLRTERDSARPLSDRQRLAVHAYYLQERNVEEARAVLGLSRSGFYRLLSSACQRLRRVMQKREVHS